MRGCLSYAEEGDYRHTMRRWGGRRRSEPELPKWDNRRPAANGATRTFSLTQEEYQKRHEGTRREFQHCDTCKYQLRLEFACISESLTAFINSSTEIVHTRSAKDCPRNPDFNRSMKINNILWVRLKRVIRISFIVIVFQLFDLMCIMRNDGWERIGKRSIPWRIISDWTSRISMYTKDDSSFAWMDKQCGADSSLNSKHWTIEALTAINRYWTGTYHTWYLLFHWASNNLTDILEQCYSISAFELLDVDTHRWTKESQRRNTQMMWWANITWRSFRRTSRTNNA